MPPASQGPVPPAAVPGLTALPPVPAPAPAPARFGAEFVCLVALLTAMVALSIDTMLPALGQMAHDLGAADGNQRQWVLMALFGGLGLGQLVFGPLSDQLGRKPTASIGLAVFAVGTLVCLLAQDFGTLVAGRLVQGLGAAGPRVVSVAMVRDQRSGAAMAQVMSMVMAVFILVPIVAPSIGQLVLAWASWRWIFGGLLVIAGALWLWLAARQPETLPPERRHRLHAGDLAAAAGRVLTHPVVWRYTVFNGVVHGGMMGYLSVAQPVYAELYGQAQHFGLFFALLAAGVGMASVLNARLVHRLGMRRLVRRALAGYGTAALLLLGLCAAYAGVPPLPMVLAVMLALFFCVGFLFGNGNALAMEPLGHRVGLAASVIGTLGTLLAMAVGATIGHFYAGTLWPLALGYGGVAVLATLLMRGAERRRVPEAGAGPAG